MSAVSFVTDAREKARWLVKHESRGPGDTRNAMERIARRYDIAFSMLWALRYRPPKDLLISTYFKIVEAHEVETDRIAKVVEHERESTAAKTWLGRALLRAADALDGSDVAAVKGEGAK